MLLAEEVGAATAIIASAIIGVIGVTVGALIPLIGRFFRNGNGKHPDTVPLSVLQDQEAKLGTVINQQGEHLIELVREARAANEQQAKVIRGINSQSRATHRMARALETLLERLNNASPHS